MGELKRRAAGPRVDLGEGCGAKRQGEKSMDREERKEALTRIFFDTEVWCKSTDKLRRAVKKTGSASRLYKEEEEIVLPPLAEPKAGIVTVTTGRTCETAQRLHLEYPKAKIGMLNFASAVRPGGGVRVGSNTQEESLCRCTTLYPDLRKEEFADSFYGFHKARKDPLFTASCIYSPDVVICKSDEALPVRLSETEWMNVDVVTCAAPDLRSLQRMERVIGDEELYGLHLKRAQRILGVAAANGCDIFISGAFGCGAFHNPPAVVASAWKEVAGSLGRYFDRLVFAIPSTSRSRENYEEFRRIFDQEEGE